MNKYIGCNCDICPLQKSTFVPPTIPENAEIAILGQAPGYDEVRIGEGFSGVSGRLLNHALKLANLDRKKIIIDNIILCYNKPGVRPEDSALQACKGHLEYSLKNVKVIIPIGNEACWALGLGDTGIMQRAGTFQEQNIRNLDEDIPF